MYIKFTTFDILEPLELVVNPPEVPEVDIL